MVDLIIEKNLVVRKKDRNEVKASKGGLVVPIEHPLSRAERNSPRRASKDVEKLRYPPCKICGVMLLGLVVTVSTKSVS